MLGVRLHLSTMYAKWKSPHYTFFCVLFSSMCIPLQSSRNYGYSTSAEQTPGFYAKEKENYVCNTISSFSLEACRNAMRISGVKEIRNFRILLLDPHHPSNMKSCLFPEKEKSSKSGVQSKSLFYHVFGEVWFPFLPWELYKCVQNSLLLLHLSFRGRSWDS